MKNKIINRIVDIKNFEKTFYDLKNILKSEIEEISLKQIINKIKGDLYIFYEFMLNFND